MQSKAATVAQYLAELPEDRRAVLSAVRAAILSHLDAKFEEGMQYGMIGYYVPHRVYPAGYHCDPKQPLPFAGLASQKNHCSLYLMCLYAPTELRTWFEKAWLATGRKLDMGKCCIRFRTLGDLDLGLLGQVVARLTAQQYISQVETALGQREEPSRKTARSGQTTGVSSAKKSTAKPGNLKPAAKKAAAKKPTRGKSTKKVSGQRTNAARQATKQKSSRKS